MIVSPSGLSKHSSSTVFNQPRAKTTSIKTRQTRTLHTAKQKKTFHDIAAPCSVESPRIHPPTHTLSIEPARSDRQNTPDGMTEVNVCMCTPRAHARNLEL